MNFIKKNLQLIIVFLASLLFLVLKLKNLSFRFGDGNAYFYMAKVFLEGQMPYKDFFFADPPFLILFLAPFKFLSGSNLIFLQALPIFLEIGTAFLLYFILKKWQNPFAWLTPIVYLFSFTVLATSDYFTGIQLTVFLTLSGIIFLEYNLPFLAGFFWCLSFLTKLYGLPAFLGFLSYFLIKKEYKKVFKIVLGAISAFVLTAGPFLLISFEKMIDFTIIHHLNRSGALDKSNVLFFFLKKEWLLIFLGIAGLFSKKKNQLLLPSLFTLTFLLFFKDLYYVYLQAFFIFLTLYLAVFLFYLKEKSEDAKSFSFAFALFCLIFIIFSFVSYKNSFMAFGRFQNAKEIASAVKQMPESLDIYGSHEVAPLIALLSDKDLFANYIDTNTQAFASNANSLEKASQKAVEKGIYLIARITDLPDYNIKDFGYEGYFKKEVFEKYCSRQMVFPSTSKEQDNLIIIYKCKVN